MTNATTAELYAAAVGRKATFYVPFFERADERGYAPMSWNWAAFLLGVFWLLYRRQYRWAAVLMAAAVLTAILAGQIALAGYPGVANAVQVAFFIGINVIYVPLNANGIYYRWVRLRLDAVKAEFAFDHDRQRTALTERYGPNRTAPAILALALALVMTLSAPAGMLVP